MKFKYKLLTFFGIFTMLFAIFPIKTLAFEKNLNVELENSVGEASFQFSFNDGQNHEIVITDPEGKQFFQSSADSTVSVVINNAKAGEYDIVINGADKEISMTGAKVVVNKTPAGTVNDSGVTVSSSLTDLKLFFMDGVLYVTWKDTNIGSVNISVTNPKNMQKLDNQTVSGTIYTLDLKSDVETVEVFIVPASSANIPGAGVSYTLDVVRDLPATVNVLPEVLTNKGEATVSVNLQDDFEVVVKNNDNEIYHEELASGVQEITFPLDAMTNNLVFYIIDDRNNIKTTTTTYTKDLVAPVITMGTDYNNTSIAEDNITLDGVVEEYSVFQIQGLDVVPDEYGRFTFDCPMEMGNNHIILFAKDEAGNEKTVELNIERVKKSGSGIFVIFFILILLAGLGTIVFLFIKKKRDEEEFVEDEEEDDYYEEEEDDEEDDISKINSFITKITSVVSRNKDEIVIEKLNPKSNKVKDIPAKETTGKKKEVPDKKVEKTSFLSKNKDSDKKNAFEKSKVDDVNKKKEREHNIMDECRKKYTITLAATLCVIIVCFIILFKFVICNTIISSGSMEPTLMTGDYVIINRLSYTAKNVERGDIISFWSDECGEYLVKRVIGIPGDEIIFRDGFIFINGAIADESAYLKDNIETNCSKSFEVPDGCVFVLGDNRENSFDSRFFENPYISQKRIVGKYLGTLANPFK